MEAIATGTMPTLWQLGLIIVGALTAVIGVFWRILVNFHKEKSERLKKYEAKEELYHKDMRELSNEVSRLVGERKGHVQGVDQVVKAVIDEIKESRQEAIEFSKKLDSINNEKNI